MGPFEKSLEDVFFEFYILYKFTKNQKRPLYGAF